MEQKEKGIFVALTNDPGGMWSHPQYIPHLTQVLATELPSSRSVTVWVWVRTVPDAFNEFLTRFSRCWPWTNTQTTGFPGPSTENGIFR